MGAAAIGLDLAEILALLCERAGGMPERRPAALADVGEILQGAIRDRCRIKIVESPSS
jgi:hypothetical protein